MSCELRSCVLPPLPAGECARLAIATNATRAMSAPARDRFRRLAMPGW